MIESLVMTMIGGDRPGLVELASACVADHGGNWLESRMSHLGGRFAGIARVEVPAERLAELKRALHGLEADGLRVVVESGAGEVAPVGLAATLELVGNDRPGILRTVTGVLAEHGVNVEELETQRGSAAMSGEMLFKARAKVHLPESCNPGQLRKELERIAEDLIVDISLQELPAAREAREA